VGVFNLQKKGGKPFHISPSHPGRGINGWTLTRYFGVFYFSFSQILSARQLKTERLKIDITTSQKW
jgi:hypothetical protein